jgi:hypothetical protein
MDKIQSHANTEGKLMARLTDFHRQQRPLWSKPTENSRCLHKRSERRTHLLIQTKFFFHIEEENGNTLTTNPQKTTNQEREAKLQALGKAREEKTREVLETHTKDEDEDDDAVDKQLEAVNRKGSPPLVWVRVTNRDKVTFCNGS